MVAALINAQEVSWAVKFAVFHDQEESGLMVYSVPLTKAV